MYNSLICKIKKCTPFCIIKYSLKNILFVKRNYLQPVLLALKFLLGRALFLYILYPCQRKMYQIRHLCLGISIHIVLLTAMTFSKSFVHSLLTYYFILSRDHLPPSVVSTTADVLTS